MIDFSFYCRASKADRNGFSPIEVSICINGKRKIIQLDRKERAGEFAKMSVSKKNNDLKVYLDSMRNQLNRAVTELRLSSVDVTPDNIKDYIRYGEVRTYTLGDCIDAFLAKQRTKVEAGECMECVYRKYVIITDYFLNHINRYVEMNAITPAQVEEFYFKMKNVYVDATLAAHMFRLKSVFRYAVDNGMCKVSPFKVRIQQARCKMEYLTEEELSVLRTAVIPNDSLSRVRDLALFQAASGLSYADMAALSKEDIKVAENGAKYIYKERQKTGVHFTAVLLPDAVDILEKYGYVLPVISNQKYNVYLKAVQDLVYGGSTTFAKKLHTHLFRKTYATYLLNAGCRLDVVSKACGHTNTRITAQTYAFMQKNTVIDEIANTVKIIK